MGGDAEQRRADESARIEAGHGAVVHATGLAAALAVTWLLLSGHYTVLLLCLGALSITLVVLIAWRMDVVDHEGVPVQVGPAAASYWPWLGLEILKSNIDVARRVLSRGPDISPTMVDVPTSQRTELGHVIFANSITLTPGTVSLELDDDRILVHAVSRDGAEALLEGEMDRRVTRMEGLS